MRTYWSSALGRRVTIPDGTEDFAVGDSVRDVKWGGTYIGTIVNVEEGWVYVQWHNTCVEDELSPADVVPAPEVSRPAGDGFRPLVVTNAEAF